MAKLQLEFEGFDNAIARLKRLDGDVKTITEKALRETHEIVTRKAEETIRSHKRTGRTESTLQRQANITWQSTVAKVDVGFDIKSGGLPSIFLMYGTPRIKKDQKLYNAFFGAQTKKEIIQAQEDIFMSEIRRLGG